MRCLVKDGDPADAVAEAIAEYHPCILVAGVKRASGTPGPHGTAFALLSASRVPVLCVPPERGGRRGRAGSCASRGNQVTGADRFRAEAEFYSGRNGTEEWAGGKEKPHHVVRSKTIPQIQHGMELTR